MIKNIFYIFLNRLSRKKITIQSHKKRIYLFFHRLYWYIIRLKQSKKIKN